MKISFCIATYNRSRVVFELVKTILSVDSNEFEVVVVDDCSTDDTVAMLQSIADNRLRVVENKKNVGSIMNIYNAIDAGKGNYLFYINDRDGVKKHKIKPLLMYLDDFEKFNVAFARCDGELRIGPQYEIYESGEQAIMEFACKITHPTGYIFKRDAWKRIKNKRVLFENEKYGDYPTANVCAILSKSYAGARILGDVCNANYERIDFKKVKSGYYKNRKDKRLWFTPEIGVRELNVALKLLRRLKIDDDIILRTVINRYGIYMHRDVNEWNYISTRRCNSYHYGIEPPKRRFYKPIENGLYIYTKTKLMLKRYYDEEKFKEQLKQILKTEIKEYITCNSK